MPRSPSPSKTKNKKFRSQAISASLTTLLGITEPAMYGVNLRLKKPMVCACVAGGIGSAVAGLFGCAGTAFALPALTTLPVFMSRAFVPFASRWRSPLASPSCSRSSSRSTT
ncbi:MAG: PTS transporter subunit EIIC [Collinsella sp.]